jgi:hypothetical protein
MMLSAISSLFLLTMALFRICDEGAMMHLHHCLLLQRKFMTSRQPHGGWRWV